MLLVANGYNAELLEVSGLEYSPVLLILNKIKSFGILSDREIQGDVLHNGKLASSFM